MPETAFEKLLTDSGIKRKVIAKKMGLSRAGFYRKQKNPKKTFDLEETVKLAEILGVDSQKVVEAILFS
ncbi:helix-turn-helix domain-containing protein [Streptococcus acidominimus]|uniref:Phage protein n=1 Tax=Streptococcus acidominimus TaxID=1326 RepID=A0A1Q8EF48_STRAI|nr:helix-turn-helix transcriptional regulator [Streptococcus acidominimus]MBF0847220.1 helix-turn-helix transcriptional regulator [Streptococcus danieliae]MBF0818328.1 helix-turn-helix transcriptional regulator [Streptococcus acidominimus]MBF0838849.1 helix-turn-helix transcriptional regulator [Streptococcus acidominimus]MBF0839519.1 helix-turn-helix transcriptional regulator [Streptococcus acidominimus]OLF50417.1 hypothetical protein BU200_02080 [Streptococcus acidominimus]